MKAATGYLTADVETILGRERRPFDASQVGYHLEAGVRVRAGHDLLMPFFHHVSRHLVDRPKTQLVDWNLVGVRLAGQLPQSLPCQGRYAVSLGHTVEWRVSVDPEARRSGDFVDFRGQVGVRLAAGGRCLDLFAAYEHRNDVFVLSPGSRDRALLGLRIGFAPGTDAGANPPIGWPGP